MKKIQFFVYMGFGLIMASMVYSYFSTFNEPGMSFATVLLALVTLALWSMVMIISFWWSIIAIPSIQENHPALTQKFPKFFNNFLLPIIIVILLLIAGQANVYMMNLQGKNLGFMSEDQFSEAKSAGIFNREKWIEVKAKQDESIKLADKHAAAVALEKKNKDYIESKINSLDKSSGKYLVAENIYKQHGVWVDDYIAVQKKSCSREFNRLLAANAASEQAIEYWNETSDSLTRSGISPFAGGRSPTTDPDIQRTNNDIRFARSQLENCGIAHLNEIEHRVTVQTDN
ncbi:TPA: hypothetical protein L8S88_002790 [Klebsiella pneumoniae]|uniref:hypothetical protein n=1 Tax=Klebsiella pneumoniae TaxID=573 RepID=UPI002730B040|nr:hypothetical protein [Klebsiella pneumoniae]EKX1850761.1 hypothetical protein [Klebsiella pneumoniae]MDP0648118.1 hypothetical protein [Klebsiella pneumoniae]MDP0743479.1 hypothetical protein [Klebsiella pneumoniae]HBQ8075622.1 hypothetical protein [Klebsiella pneumoniae]HBQ8090996.1 hypothetical protein [Klebsiella pneumoniae]